MTESRFRCFDNKELGQFYTLAMAAYQLHFDSCPACAALRKEVGDRVCDRAGELRADIYAIEGEMSARMEAKEQAN